MATTTNNGNSPDPTGLGFFNNSEILSGDVSSFSFQKYMDDQHEFIHYYSQKHSYLGDVYLKSLQDNYELRISLVREELNELEFAFEDYLEKRKTVSVNHLTYEIGELFKEYADLLYVVMGLGATFNLPVQGLLNIVHSSNMNKVWEDGTIHRNEKGKIVKPPSYRSPNLEPLVKEYLEID